MGDKASLERSNSVGSAGAVVSATFSGTFPVASTTYVNVGVPLVLPVGKWRVNFDVRNLTIVTSGAGFARLRLYNTTLGAVVANSERQGVLTTGTGGGTTPITMDLDITGETTTIDLQAARDTAATYSACQIIGDADGWTHATACRRAP